MIKNLEQVNYIIVLCVSQKISWEDTGDTALDK